MIEREIEIERKKIVKQPTDTKITLNYNEWGKQRFIFFWINLRGKIASLASVCALYTVRALSSTLRFAHAFNKLLEVQTGWCVHRDLFKHRNKYGERAKNAQQQQQQQLQIQNDEFVNWMWTTLFWCPFNICAISLSSGRLCLNIRDAFVCFFFSSSFFFSCQHYVWSVIMSNDWIGKPETNVLHDTSKSAHRFRNNAGLNWQTVRYLMKIAHKNTRYHSHLCDKQYANWFFYPLLFHSLALLFVQSVKCIENTF